MLGVGKTRYNMVTTLAKPLWLRAPLAGLVFIVGLKGTLLSAAIIWELGL
jgi:hypothetical protein